MKVCLHTIHSIDRDYIGGTERFIIKFAKELKVLGYEVFVVCSSLKEEGNVEGIKVYGRIPLEHRDVYLKYNSNTEFLLNEILENNPSEMGLKKLSRYTESQIDKLESDIIHFNSFASVLFLSPKKNYFVTNHENKEEYDGKWGEGFFDFITKLISSRTTSLDSFENLFTPSLYYASFFSSIFGLKIKSVPLGIHLQDFLPFDKNHKPSGNSVKLMLPSRFKPSQKGHLVALEACRILKSYQISFQMTFTGVKSSYTNEVSEFLNKVNEYGLSKEIKIVTYNDIREGLKECDIVISPEKYCSYGLAISEALSLGIPTFLSDIPTYLEIANDFEHAFFFKSESSDSLARALMKFLRSPNENRAIDMIKFRLKNDLRDCAKTYGELYLSDI